MADLMTFPNTVEEFMEKYKIVDTYCVYTNGVEMVPIFRMQQWFDHVQQSAEEMNREPPKPGTSEQSEADMWRELAASYERTIVKLTEAIAEQAQNAGAKMT